ARQFGVLIVARIGAPRVGPAGIGAAGIGPARVRAARIGAADVEREASMLRREPSCWSPIAMLAQSFALRRSSAGSEPLWMAPSNDTSCGRPKSFDVFRSPFQSIGVVPGAAGIVVAVKKVVPVMRTMGTSVGRIGVPSQCFAAGVDSRDT